MPELEDKREKDIKNMIGLLRQMDASGIMLITRDANTLLTHQKIEDEKNTKKPKGR